MSNISPSKPSFLLTYYNPFDKNAPGLVESYLNYAKDVNLAQYGASIVSAAIEKASKMQSIQLQNGFKMIDQRLSSMVYEQVTTNLLLNDIKDLLKLPDSEKEKLFHINSGLKFLSKVNYNDSMIKDAIHEFEMAYKISPNDWFVNYYLGVCYLHYPNVLNLEKAERYYTTSIKYASIEDNYSLQSSYKSAFYAIENKNTELVYTKSWPKVNDEYGKHEGGFRWIEKREKDEYYDCLARPNFHLADSYLNLANIKYIKGDFEFAYNFCKLASMIFSSGYKFSEMKFMEKIRFYETKYLARCLNNKLKTIEDSESIKEIKSIIFLEAALNDKDILLIPEYVKILQRRYKSALNKLNNGTVVKKAKPYSVDKPNTVDKPLLVNNNNLQIKYYWWSRKTTVILLTILFWPLGVYGWYMRAKNKSGVL